MLSVREIDSIEKGHNDSYGYQCVDVTRLPYRENKVPRNEHYHQKASCYDAQKTSSLESTPLVFNLGKEVMNGANR